MHEKVTLKERCQHWQDGLTVDQNSRMVTGVALAGPQSKNGYRYSEQVLTESVPLYDHKPVFLDHAPHATKPMERSTRDLVGHIINPRFENGRVRGDILVLETESGQTFLQLVKSGAPGVGMSHVVLARRSADSAQVVAIEEVISVDVVVNPATTTTFQESCDNDTTRFTRLQERLDRLNSERDQLRSELSDARCQLVALQRECLVNELLEGSSLPSTAVTNLFREQLRLAATEQECRNLIHDREQLLTANHRALAPVMSDSRFHESRGITDDEFIRRLKHR
ncbi:MAG: hypothetical protein KDA80_06945 [Planctomycetaceae bacterium]|nr:hypothetical protein [Planctomycetaceae bacterium]